LNSKEDKIERVVDSISKVLKNILGVNPDYTGSININFCSGGVTSIQKKENMKV